MTTSTTHDQPREAPGNRLSLFHTSHRDPLAEARVWVPFAPWNNATVRQPRRGRVLCADRQAGRPAQAGRAGKHLQLNETDRRKLALHEENRVASAERRPILARVSEQGDTGWARLSSVRIGAVVALALAAAFVVWLLVRGNDDSSSEPTTAQTTTTAATGPVAATPAALRALSDEVGHPIYWIGPQRGRTYELTRTASGRIFVRYLPSGAKVGNRSASYTIVGTYPVSKALQVLQDLSKQPGEKRASVPGGGLAVYSTSSPTNVYVAYPGSDVQIEVFDPSAAKALRLVTSGRVAPVG
jgi:hypothetical protein